MTTIVYEFRINSPRFRFFVTSINFLMTIRNLISHAYTRRVVLVSCEYHPRRCSGGILFALANTHTCMRGGFISRLLYDRNGRSNCRMKSWMDFCDESNTIQIMRVSLPSTCITYLTYENGFSASFTCIFSEHRSAADLFVPAHLLYRPSPANLFRRSEDLKIFDMFEFIMKYTRPSMLTMLP